MPSQFFGLNIGASALSAFQTSVNTAANNVANVQTKGYTRQTANLSATDPIRVYTRYGSVGTGVEVTSVTQERNLYYDEKYWQSNSAGDFSNRKCIMWIRSRQSSGMMSNRRKDFPVFFPRCLRIWIP